MYQNQNQNNFHLHLNHSLLAVIAVTNLLLIATIWYAPTINASYASSPAQEVPASVVSIPTPVPAQQQPPAPVPAADPYASQYYPMQNQPATYYYPSQAPTYYAPTNPYAPATPYSQGPTYDPSASGYYYQPPVKFLVGL